MPLGLDYVDRVNKEQRLARERFNQGQALTNEGLSDIQNSAVGRALGLPRINELEQFIFKLRTELINYLIENAYIDGLKFDGFLYKPEGGKIVITADMIQAVVSKFGYITNQEAAELIAKMIGEGDFASKTWVSAYVTQYLVDNFYVSDEHYVHTDNNFTDADKDKLDGLEIPVEDVQLNGTSVLNRETKVANVIITKEMVKEWYESNPDTNALTDAEKLKLSRVPDDLQTVLDEIIAHEKSHDLDIIEIKQLNARQETHLTQLDAEQVTQNIDIEENKQNIINLTTDVALIKKKDESQDEEIAALKEKDTEQDSVIEGLSTDLDDATANIAGLQADVTSMRNLLNKKVSDVTLDGTSVVDDNMTAVFTASMIKASYESNENTNVFTDEEKRKLQDLGTDLDDATANIAELQADVTSMRNLLNKKVSDVTLDGTSVVDDNMTAVFTASMIKASYESNENTNVFTDEEKRKLQDLGTDLDDATANIAGLQADVTSMRNLLNKKVSDVTLDGTSVVDDNMTAVFTASMIKASYESNENTNPFTDNDKSMVDSLYDNELKQTIFTPFGTDVYVGKSQYVVTDYIDLLLNPGDPVDVQLRIPITLITAYSKFSTLLYFGLNSVVTTFTPKIHTPYGRRSIWDSIPKTIDLLLENKIWPCTFAYLNTGNPVVEGIATLPATNYIAWKDSSQNFYPIATSGIRFGYVEKPTSQIPTKDVYLYIGGFQPGVTYTGGFIATVYPCVYTKWPFDDSADKNSVTRKKFDSTLIISK